MLFPSLRAHKGNERQHAAGDDADVGHIEHREADEAELEEVNDIAVAQPVVEVGKSPANTSHSPTRAVPAMRGKRNSSTSIAAHNSSTSTPRSAWRPVSMPKAAP